MESDLKMLNLMGHKNTTRFNKSVLFNFYLNSQLL